MKNFKVLFFVITFFSSFLNSSQVSSSLKQTSSNEELSAFFNSENSKDVISSGEVTPSTNNLPYVSNLDNLSYKSFLDAENYEGLVDTILKNQPEIYQSRGMTKEQMKMYLLVSMNQFRELGLLIPNNV